MYRLPLITDLYPVQPGAAAAQRVGISIHTPGDDIDLCAVCGDMALGLHPHIDVLLIGNSPACSACNVPPIRALLARIHGKRLA